MSPVGQVHLIIEDSRSHSNTPHSVEILWTSDQRVAEISDNTQQTDIHAPGGIRTRNLSKRAAADPRLGPRGHRPRHLYVFSVAKRKICYCPSLSMSGAIPLLPPPPMLSWRGRSQLHRFCTLKAYGGVEA